MKKAEKIRIADQVISRMKNRAPVIRMEKACYKALEQYLFETKDSCYCSACDRTFSITKLDKHNSIRKCPKCRKEVKVQRNNGRRNIKQNIAIAYAEKVDQYLLVRYYQFFRTLNNLQDGKCHVSTKFLEVGRQILSYGVNIRMEKVPSYTDGRPAYEGNEWYIIGDTYYAGNWFTPSKDIFRWHENKYCIQRSLFDPKSLSMAFDEFINRYSFNAWQGVMERNSAGFIPYDIKGSDKRADCFTDLLEKGIYSYYYQTCEKMASAGLEALFVESERRYSEVERFFTFCKTPDDSIKKILRLNADEYRLLLKTDRSEKSYTRIRNYKAAGISVPMMEKLIACDCSVFDYSILQKRGHVEKTVNYLIQNNVCISEYLHYLDLLDQVGAKMDKSNLFPANFDKADYELAVSLEGPKNRKVKKMAAKIKKAMMKSEAIKEMMKGSAGLIVKVPETAEELVREGKKMHNCLGTYGTKVGSGKTQIFFIRRIEDPDKPFYAMEYRNGEICQLYTYNNEHDESYEQVSIFCTEFVRALDQAMKVRK